jgi:hypothetical protein
MTQKAVIISLPTRPLATTVYTEGKETGRTQPDTLDISGYQSAKKIVDYQLLNQKENRNKVYSLVWQQCIESMHAKIKSNTEYKEIEEALDGIQLLKVIKLICFNIEDEKNTPHKVHESKAAFYALK